MAKTPAQQRNHQRRRIFKNVLRHSKTLTDSLDAEEVEKERQSFLEDYKRISDKIPSKIRRDLRKSELYFISVKYEEAAERLEHAAYLTVLLSELSDTQVSDALLSQASEYFQQAYECYLFALKHPNKFIDHTKTMESLRQKSVACFYEHRRREAVQECKESFWKYFSLGMANGD